MPALAQQEAVEVNEGQGRLRSEAVARPFEEFTTFYRQPWPMGQSVPVPERSTSILRAVELSCQSAAVKYANRASRERGNDIAAGSGVD
jgi:hypothetical protein